jgi:phenylalanyl-tRNA synthetase beta chain
MPMRDLDRLLGIRVSMDRAAETLSLLGFDVELGEKALAVTVPFWRRADIALSADLVEEVARLIGFDEIPATLPEHTVPPPAPLSELRWEEVSRRALLAVGVSELVTHVLTSWNSTSRLLTLDGASAADDGEGADRIVVNAAGVYAQEALTEPVRLMNPPNRERTQLRMTLVPSLVDEVARNLRHTEERVAFFEIARTYFRRPVELPYERRTLAIALAARSSPLSWQQPAPRAYSYYDLKGMIEAVLSAVGVGEWHVERAVHAALHPGRSAALCLGGESVGYFGELHPGVAAAFQIEDQPVVVGELDLDAIFPHATDQHLFHPIPRYPPARRDIAVLVDDTVPAADIEETVRRAGLDLLDSARIFDVYSGEPLPVGKKSIAIAMEFRSPGATLTQEEVNAEMSHIVDALSRELNASLRE